MTESEWLVSEDPQAMLTALLPTRSGDMSPIQYEGGRGGISDRKLGLFACGCWRASKCRSAAMANSGGRTELRYADMENDTALPDQDYLALAQVWVKPDDSGFPQHGPVQAVKAAILRDIVGNPWRLVEIPCDWKTRLTDGSIAYHGALWLTPTVLGMAQTVYDECRFEDLSIMADALEDTGCDEVEILQHCRGKEKCPNAFKPHLQRSCDICGSGIIHDWIPLRGQHVRGCWVLDLFLGKE